jgi:hypothetical protein
MNYPQRDGQIPPQDYSNWPQLLYPNREQLAIEDNSLASYAQWVPFPSHDQGSHLSSPVVQTYGNSTAFHSNDLINSQTTLSPSLYPNNMVPQGHQLLFSNNTSAANAQPMAPPPNPRKRKAPTLRREDWEPVKARIFELHITHKKPLPEVKQIVEKEFESSGFSAT